MSTIQELLQELMANCGEEDTFCELLQNLLKANDYLQDKGGKSLADLKRELELNTEIPIYSIDAIQSWARCARKPWDVSVIHHILTTLGYSEHDVEHRELVDAYTCDRLRKALLDLGLMLMDFKTNQPNQETRQYTEAYLKLLLEVRNAIRNEQDAYPQAFNKLLAFEKSLKAQGIQGTEEKTLLEVLLEGTVDTPKGKREKRRILSLGVVTSLAAVFVIAIALVYILKTRNQTTTNPTPAPPEIALAVSEFDPALVVLDTDANAQYSRENWEVAQTLTVGTQLNPSDIIVADTLNVQVLCPDGTIQTLTDSNLAADGTLTCVAGTNPIMVAHTVLETPSGEKGGIERLDVSYLRAPRRTLLRSSDLTLVWNAVDNALHYTVTVWADAETVYESEDLSPLDITDGDSVSLHVPITLVTDVAYTVEICVVDATTLEERCTNDPGIAGGVNLAFYYHPSSVLDAAEQAIIRELGDANAESLYSRALLLAQPWYLPDENADALGYYGDAITLLEQLIQNHPNSALAQSADLYNLLGELYRRVDLSLSATLAYRQARDLAPDGSEAAAIAAWGEASASTADSDTVVELYEAALDTYESFLDATAFASQFETTCKQMGGLCLRLQRCSEHLEVCTNWILGSE